MVPARGVGVKLRPGTGNSELRVIWGSLGDRDAAASVTIATVRVTKKNEIKWKECCATLPFVNFIMAHSFRLLNL